MLATIRDDTWNVLNMQLITPNSKRWNYSDIPGGGHKKHMAEGGQHLRKAPNLHPLAICKNLVLRALTCSFICHISVTLSAVRTRCNLVYLKTNALIIE